MRAVLHISVTCEGYGPACARFIKYGPELQGSPGMCQIFMLLEMIIDKLGFFHCEMNLNRKFMMHVLCILPCFDV